MKKDDSVFLSLIVEAIVRARSHVGKATRSAFMKSETRKAAVVRELEIVGEAARQLSDATRGSIPEVDWSSVIGMRNRLVHGYFDVDYDVVWDTLRSDLPHLEEAASRAADRLGPKVHPWRICPIGKHWVRVHPRRLPRGPGTTEVDGHCRLNRSRKDQLYPDEIRRMADLHFGSLSGGPSSDDLGHPLGAAFDGFIRGWTRYWNDTLGEADLLDPDVVKALIGSESGFRPKPPAQSARAAGKARGLLQLTDQALRALANEKGELKDHLVTLTRRDVLDPNFSICAGIRWLFHKRKLAGHRLKRPATWDEAVAEYKAYLGEMQASGNVDVDGMRPFRRYLARLKGRE